MKEETKKRRNTAIFITIATILNSLLMIVFVIIGFLLLTRFVDPESDSVMVWLVVIFAVSFGGSWLIYRGILKIYTKHVDVENTFAPVFASRKPRNRKKSSNEGKE